MRSYKDLNISYQGSDLYVQQKKCQLSNLDGCPEVITGSFYCCNNDITSLIGGPQKVDGFYDCDVNQLTNLVGCASHIGNTLRFRNNQKITSLVGIHKIIKSCQYMYFDCENITEGGIGLLLIENLADISDHMIPFNIIRGYFGTGTKGMMECSKELKEKGFEQYAKL